eukprot:g4802.t1
MNIAPSTPNADGNATRKPFWAELTDVACSDSGSKVLFATDDWFSNAEHMLSAEPPVFIPGKFTSYGKWMDGWESRRKRIAGHDWCIIRLAFGGAKIRGFMVDTGFFTGNQAPRISIQGACLRGAAASEKDLELVKLRDSKGVEAGGGFAATREAFDVEERLFGSQRWETLLDQVELNPGYEDSRYHHFDALGTSSTWTHIRVNIFPDGGVARLRVHGEVVPEADHGSAVLDVAAAENGGVTLGASNAHYGRVSNLIAPGRAKNMGEGWESARNPKRPAILEVETGGKGILKLPASMADWAIIRLCTASDVSLIEVDTNHFKGNCPESCVIEGATIDSRETSPESELTYCTSASGHVKWRPLLPRTSLRPHARQYFSVAEGQLVNFRGVTHVRLTIYPDGGVSRLRIHGTRSTLAPKSRAKM